MRVVAPSQDTDGGWCKMPIRYNGGLFYVKSEVTNDKKNFTLICGYEKTIDGKLEKTVWEVDGTLETFFALPQTLSFCLFVKELPASLHCCMTRY